MAVVVTHATVATGTDAGNGSIHKAEWNENHVVTNAADVTASNTFLAAQTINAIAGTVLTVTNGPSGGTPSTTHGELLVDSNDANMGIHILGNNTANQKILFGSVATPSAGQITYVQSSDTLTISTASTARFSIDGSGNTLFNVNVGVGNADTQITRTRTGQIAVAGKNIPYLFAQSGTATSVGAVTTEATLATISFSGGEIGPNGWIQVLSSWTLNNTANAKNCRIRVGGAAGTIMSDGNPTSAVFFFKPVWIINSNSASSQKAVVATGNTAGTGTGTSAPPTATVNTASAWDLVLTGQKATAGDTLTLEGYQVFVCYGA